MAGGYAEDVEDTVDIHFDHRPVKPVARAGAVDAARGRTITTALKAKPNAAAKIWSNPPKQPT